MPQFGNACAQLEGLAVFWVNDGKTTNPGFPAILDEIAISSWL
jgi:hypothetical protein